MDIRGVRGKVYKGKSNRTWGDFFRKPKGGFSLDLWILWKGKSHRKQLLEKRTEIFDLRK